LLVAVILHLLLELHDLLVIRGATQMHVIRGTLLWYMLCPTYGEGTLLCQNFTFMNGSDDAKLRRQSREIWYAYHLLSVTFIFYLLTPFSNMCPVYCVCWCWLLHYLPSWHILPFVDGCIHCIPCFHSGDCCTYLVFLVALPGYLLTRV